MSAKSEPLAQKWTLYIKSPIFNFSKSLIVYLRHHEATLSVSSATVLSLNPFQINFKVITHLSCRKRSWRVLSQRPEARWRTTMTSSSSLSSGRRHRWPSSCSKPATVSWRWKGFSTSILRSYTSSPLDGMARNHISCFHLLGYTIIAQFILSGTIHPYLLCPRREDKPFSLSWNQTQVLVLQLFTIDHSYH